MRSNTARDRSGQIVGREPSPFWANVHFGPTCHEWMGAKTSSGYGLRLHNGKVQRAHRVAWQLMRGPIPPGVVVMHRCDNPPCVNLDHLSLGTTKDNAADMVAKRRHHRHAITACPSGHPYSTENTRVYRGRRYCRECLHISNRRAR